LIANTKMRLAELLQRCSVTPVTPSIRRSIYGYEISKVRNILSLLDLFFIDLISQIGEDTAQPFEVSRFQQAFILLRMSLWTMGSLYETSFDVRIVEVHHLQVDHFNSIFLNFSN